MPDCSSGYYAIFVDDYSSLPRPFSDEATSRGSDLIYLGKTRHSLRERLVDQDLHHEQPSTFFRSLGAVLGFRPPRGSFANASDAANYRFSDSDTSSIIRWIDDHMTVSWVEDESASDQEEGLAIVALTPLLNIKKNPEKLLSLEYLRTACRQIAATDPSAPRRFSVYVIDLDPAVLLESRFLARNPGYVKGNPCVYVGSTALTPEERFVRHKGGRKSNRYAEVYGRRLRRGDFERYKPMATREQAERQEARLASDLRKKGYAVWQG